MTASQSDTKNGEIEVTVRIANFRNSPMLMNPATEELLDELGKGPGARAKVRTDRTPQQIAENRLYKDPQGNLGVPADNLLACLVAAGRFIKYEGKMMLSSAEESRVTGLLSIGEAFLPFDPATSNLEWTVSRKRGRLPKDGTAVCIVRPEISKWETNDFHITFDPNDIAETKIKELFRKAGRMVGLGDFRAARKGRYGKFHVVKWETRTIAEA